MSDYGQVCKCCGLFDYTEPREEKVMETNEFLSLWPVSDRVIRNEYYKQFPQYTVQYKQTCKNCGMILHSRAVRDGFPPACKGVQS